MPLLFITLLGLILAVNGCAMNHDSSSKTETYPDPWVASLLMGSKEPERSVLKSGYIAFSNPPSSGGLGCIRCHSLKRGEYFRIIPSAPNRPPLVAPSLYSAYAHLPGYVYNRIMNVEMAIRACLRYSKDQTFHVELRTMDALIYFVQALSLGQRVSSWGGKLPCLGCHSPKHAVPLYPERRPPTTLHAIPKRWTSQSPKRCLACHLHPWKLGGLTSLGFAYATKPAINPQKAEKSAKIALKNGSRLFWRTGNLKKRSCAGCHAPDPLKPFWRPYQAKDLAFAKTRTPLGPNGEVLTLSRRIRRCIDRHMGNDPAYQSQEARLSLEVYVASLAEGREFGLWGTPANAKLTGENHGFCVVQRTFPLPRP